MFIPNSENHEEKPSAAEVMDTSLSHLWNTYILPNVDKTDVEEMEMLTLIGIALRDIQDKASAYEAIQSKKDYFSRN
jgi:hypothetical protein